MGAGRLGGASFVKVLCYRDSRRGRMNVIIVIASPCIQMSTLIRAMMAARCGFILSGWYRTLKTTYQGRDQREVGTILDKGVGVY